MHFPIRFFTILTTVCIIPPFLLAAPVKGLISGRNIETMTRVEVHPATKGLVMVFLSAKCPCSMSHIDELKSLVQEFKEFAFVGVHSNQDEALATSQESFRALRLPFVILEDETAKLADKYQAVKTPQVFVLNPQGKVLYQGGVTNSNVAQKADKHLLREALTAIRAGQSVPNLESKALGCAIVRAGASSTPAVQ